MKHLFISIVAILITSSMFSQSESGRNADITGVWHAEAYFDDDVMSIDTFIILKYNNAYGIVCTSYEYFGVTEIHRNDSNLEFIMLNTLSKDNIYILDYQCKIISEDKIKCSFENQIGEVERNITWTRIYLD